MQHASSILLPRVSRGIEDRASIEHERGVWGDMLSRVLVGSQVAAWGLWGGETPLAGAFPRP